jgi:hypothetical protein
VASYAGTVEERKATLRTVQEALELAGLAE